MARESFMNTGARSWLFRRLFRFWQRLGVHVTPNHFYQPIPDTSKLGDDPWSHFSDMVGVNPNEARQLELLAAFRDYAPSYETFPKNPTAARSAFYLDNGMFESVDAEILYCFIRHFKPRRIMEIGSGFSTLLSAKAILDNRSADNTYQCRLTAIDPYPRQTLKDGFPGLSALIQRPVQSLSPSFFEDLETNDILFIDSSHVLKIGGDVRYEFLDLIPRVRAGVLVHVHDIFLPAEYPKHWIIHDLRFFSEQYLLQAFLAFNNSFEVLWAGNYMHLNHPDALTSAFQSYDPDKVHPGSFWMRRTE
jgi:hypothetical protein